MDDDIDIEEHDVLENPAIKSIFPDLSIIKKEILFYDEQAFAQPEVDIELKKSSITPSEGFKCHNSHSIDSDDVKFVMETKNYDETRISTLQPDTQETPLFQNKIILGSRPAQKSLFQEYEENAKLYSAKVYVSDIGTYLENSTKFCKICRIFFSQKIDLHTHNKEVHEINACNTINITSTVQPQECNTMNIASTVQPQECNTMNIASTVQPLNLIKHKCEKCFNYFATAGSLKRHLENIHNEKFKSRKSRLGRILKNNLVSKSESSKSKLPADCRCFHCKKWFPSQTSLINHIYNVLQSATLNQQTHQKLMQSKKKIKDTYITKKKLMLKKTKMVKNNKMVEIRTKSVDQDKVFYLFKCCYCSYYCQDTKNYQSHLANKHRDYNVILPDKVMFDPCCKFCFVKQDNIRRYNCHLHFRHAAMLNKTFKIEPQISLTRIEFILAMKQRTIIQNNCKSSGQTQEELHSYQDNTSETNSDKVEEEDEKKRKFTRKPLLSSKKMKIDEGCSETFEENIDMNREQNEHLVLKGILFRCKRCDIHFLTSRCAMNHSEHMELLINWKCQKCLKIFKKQDEYLHNQQHCYSDEFVVYELSESKLSRVLYKCSKCAIHFNDVNYAFHFKFCGKIVTESSYCKACDILLEKSVRPSHDYEHQTNNQSLADFTIVTSDTIMSTNTYKHTVDKKIKTLVKKPKRRRQIKTEDTLKFSYCDTCKCFISRLYFRAVHKERRCNNMIKHVCTYCGLVMTNKALDTHRKRHLLEKDLKLQDFKFYDIKTNKRILPPIPDYPKCCFCDVHFISKVAVLNHVCNENEFLTCPICDIKLSDEAFKLHLSFHHYDQKNSKNSVLSRALINESRGTKKNNQSEGTKRKGKPRLPNKIDDDRNGSYSFHNLEIGKKKPHTDDQVNRVIQREKVELVEPKKKVSQTVLESVNLRTAEIDNRIKITEKLHNSRSDEKTDFELGNVVYCCSYCYITLLNFEQAVEHCQDHYSDVDMSKQILTCTECKMKYYQRDCHDHKKIHDLHRLQPSQNSLKVLKFDAAYFAFDYKLWMEKLFEKLETHLSQSIVNGSIYKYEGRVKLTVIQKGTSDVTVYKCKACCMFVDPCAILSHTENSCYKLRKHICTYCGIAFVSHVYRMSHEKVHNNRTELTVNSFKIVLFNRDKDRMCNMRVINSRNNFIMFQCRKCKGIFERFQSRLHECNKLDLKKCPICSLLMLNAGYKSHMMKHALISSFIHSNMKIIRFGKNDTISESSGLPFNFGGIVKDYSFYKCLRCNVYIKKSKLLKTEHDCLDNNAKIICNICNLNILKKHLIDHNKMHKRDPYFMTENFNILLMKETHVASSETPKEDHSKVNEEIEIEENISLVRVNLEKKLNTNKEKNLVVDNGTIIVRVAKIYKCDCKLCFLEKNSIFLHFGHCKSSKIIRQTCTKCSLIFSPKDLFNHLLKHHGDKKYLYKFNIIRMNQMKNKIIELYNCSLCNMHFIECENAKEHFNTCLNSVNEENKCEQCHLCFDKACLEFHKNNHHSDNVADFDIIDIKEEPKHSDGNRSSEKDIENIASLPVDGVIDTNYTISEENLSQISLNVYSNTIYKCIECKIHFLTESTFRTHLQKGGHVKFSSPQKDCEHCGLNFSLQSLAKHIYVHHNQMMLELSQINIKSAIVDSKELATD